MDINQALAPILGYVHQVWKNDYFDAAIVVFIYIVLAKVTDLLIDKIVKRLAQLTHIKSDDAIIAFIHRPLCLTIVLLGLLHVSVQLPLAAPWDFIAFKLIKSFILIVWWVSAIKSISAAIQKPRPIITGKGAISQELFFLFRNLLRIVILASGVLALLMIWDVSLTPLFASAGIAGIAVAMAAKDTLANFFGGISIFMDKTYKVGDYIIIDSGERGEVVDIGIRSTRIKTRDDILISIPNSVMANAKIINESAPIPRFRIRVPVGVAYGSDLKEVEELLNNIALQNSRVVKEFAPRTRVRRFGDSSIDLELLCWVEDPRLKGLVIHELFKEIYETFDKEGITIPFPQRDIHIVDGQGQAHPVAGESPDKVPSSMPDKAK